MKTLKKSLCLVLAVVMVVGVLALGVNAAADIDLTEVKTDYREAAELITALGVMTENDNGFDPEGKLARAQAVTIAARVALARSNADLLKPNAKYASAPDWFAATLSYCEDNNIMVGGDGGDQMLYSSLTGLQFAKMLMVVLGYDPDYEGFTGDNWAANIRTKAQSIDLNAGLPNALIFDISREITREEACQMAFNALFIERVDYTVSGGTITAGDVTITPNKTCDGNSSFLYSVHGLDAATGTKPGHDDTRDVALNKVRDTDVDGSKRPSYVYKIDGDVIVEVAKPADYTVVVTGSKTLAEWLETKTKKVTLNWTAASNAPTGTLEYENGTLKTSASGGTCTPYYADGSSLKLGDIIEFYVDSATPTKIAKVCVTRYSSAMISGAVTTRTENKTELVRVPGVAEAASYVDADTVEGWEDLSKGDVVYYYVDADEVVHLNKADSITGVHTKTSNGKYTIDGTAYPKNGNITLGTTMGTSTMGNTFTYWLDDNGFIVYNKIVEANNDTKYAMILDIHYVAGSSFNDSNYVEVKMVNEAGEVLVGKVASVDGRYKVDPSDRSSNSYASDELAIDTATGGTISVNVHSNATGLKAGSTPKVVTYYVNNSGAYVITTVSGTNSALTTNDDIENSKAATTGGVSVNSNTIFVVNKQSDGSGSFDVYKGMKAVPNITNVAANQSAALVQNNYATIMFINKYGNSDAAASSDIILLGSSTGSATELVGTDKPTLYTYPAVVDGEIKNVKLDGTANSAFAGPGSYTPTWDKTGTYISKVTASALTSSIGYNFANGSLVTSAGSYVCADTVPVYYKAMNANTFAEMYSTDFTSADTNDVVYVKANAQNVASYVIIVETGEGEGLKSLVGAFANTTLKKLPDGGYVPTGKVTLTDGANANGATPAAGDALIIVFTDDGSNDTVLTVYQYANSTKGNPAFKETYTAADTNKHFFYININGGTLANAANERACNKSEAINNGGTGNVGANDIVTFTAGSTYYYEVTQNGNTLVSGTFTAKNVNRS